MERVDRARSDWEADSDDRDRGGRAFMQRRFSRLPYCSRNFGLWHRDSAQDLNRIPKAGDRLV